MSVACWHGKSGLCAECDAEDAALREEIGTAVRIMNPRKIAIDAARNQYQQSCNGAFMILGINRSGAKCENELADAEVKCRRALQQASSAYLVAARLAGEIPEAEI